MTVVCAFRPAGIDVKRTLRSAAPDDSIGRKARLQGSHREGLHSAPKPAFRCGRETGFSARRDLWLSPFLEKGDLSDFPQGFEVSSNVVPHLTALRRQVVSLSKCADG
jgi:hypothetical protein